MRSSSPSPAAVGDVAVVTSMAPTTALPYRGSFVLDMAAAVAPRCRSLEVYHCDPWTAHADRVEKIYGPHSRTVRGYPDTAEVDGYTLRYLPTLSASGAGHAGLAEWHARFLAELRADGLLAADLVHTHLGLPSGWAAAQVLDPGTPLFVTEHASFLDEMLAEPRARAQYAELLDRVTRLCAVGDGLRDKLAGYFPRHADKLTVVANPVLFQPGEVPARLRRWVAIGSLIPRKRNDLIVRALAECRRADPGLTLTLIGSGEEEEPLRALAADLGLGDAVRFTGSVPPAQARALLREHDLFVQASTYETFGVAILEAIGAGLPVVVTRCGGPEETLADVIGDVGEFVDVADAPDALVDGYRALCRRHPGGLDLHRGAKALDTRYGPAAVAEQHVRIWTGAQR